MHVADLDEQLVVAVGGVADLEGQAVAGGDGGLGSSHGVGGKVESEVLSVVCAQLEPIHADCMEEVNRNIDTIIQYMETGARGFPGYDLFVTPESLYRGCTRPSG